MLKFKIKLFLSYSIKDENFAKQLRNKLQYYPLINVFMAPDDISYGVLWAEEIKSRIQSCDAVIALITKNFHTSDWTEQEMGLAWAFEKRIIGLTTDNSKGNGYVSRFQINPIAESLYDNVVDELVLKIYPEIENKDDFIEHLVKNLLPNSTSYYQSNCIGRILKVFTNNLNLEYSNSVINSFKTNHEVRGAHFWINVIQNCMTDPEPFLTTNHTSKSDLKNALDMLR